MTPDFDTCYKALSSRDPRFDGWFFTGVTSTGIYCRPSCPAIAPKRENVRFYPTAAAAQGAGFRACKRCRPDASPGSPEWNLRGDLVARAMRLIADGIVDREGVAGLARRLHFSERHLHRQLLAEVGAGPQALARAQRAQTARILIETTPLKMSDVAFASGFASIRQFNDTIREVFAESPTGLRRRTPKGQSTPGAITLRLPYRSPLDAHGLLHFLGERAVPGVESFNDGIYRRTLQLHHSVAIAEYAEAEGHIRLVLRLGDLRDLASAIGRSRRMLDLDADPDAIIATLSAGGILGPLLRRNPGLRVPGTADPNELAMRAVLGQQVTVAGARTLAGRLVERFGKPLTATDGDLTHCFPEVAVVADADLTGLGMPGARMNTLRSIAGALDSGRLDLDPGADRDEVATRLHAIKGVGPWTVAYIAMRALKDPDAFPGADLGVLHALEALGVTGKTAIAEAAERWRPWRAYAVQHLWASLGPKDLKPASIEKRRTR
ncbi:MAG: AraC family transcriptional regulator [Actinomycetota bacterium]|nr:AraC family transcriptional regulator [Actinomycetota bacterium]